MPKATIRALIVDDEEDARKLIRMLLRDYCPQIEVLGEADGVESAFAAIQRTQPDLVFLDIQLQDGSGFDLLQKFTEIPFQTIFATGYDQYALRAFEFCALDYLLKPVSSDDLVRAVNRLQPNRQYEQFELLLQSIRNGAEDARFTKLALHTIDRLQLIPLVEITHLEADKGYSTFFLQNGKRYTVAKSIGEYEKLLPAKDFFRIHVSHLIHRAFVREYIKSDGGMVVLADGKQLPLARRRREPFLVWLREGDVLF